MIKLSDLIDVLMAMQVKIVSYEGKEIKVLYEGYVRFAQLYIEDMDEYKILNIFNCNDNKLEINVYR